MKYPQHRTIHGPVGVKIDFTPRSRTSGHKVHSVPGRKPTLRPNPEHRGVKSILTSVGTLMTKNDYWRNIWIVVDGGSLLRTVPAMTCLSFQYCYQYSGSNAIVFLVRCVLASTQSFFAVLWSQDTQESESTGWHFVTFGHFLLEGQIQDGRHKFRVFCDFRPLDDIFLYANVTPMLYSSQNVFLWYMA